MNTLQEVEQKQIEKLTEGKPAPEFAPGDTVRVSVKVVEGERTRVQNYEGVCIARSNKGLNSNFTVRKISYGEGVERVFPLFAPIVDKVEVIRKGRVRRAAGRRPVSPRPGTPASGRGRSRRRWEAPACRAASPPSARTGTACCPCRAMAAMNGTVSCPSRICRMC